MNKKKEIRHLSGTNENGKIGRLGRDGGSISFVFRNIYEKKLIFVDNNFYEVVS